ncbi:MAG: hypothetical protein QM763_20415 [Agriterribacter sp.]
MNNSYAIFVNTTDKFEDCWEPFFKLFSIYWPGYKGKIYLNTEYKTYQYPGLNIVSLKNCEQTKDADKATWSDCLIRGWTDIDNDVILYMQEDYFFNAPVQNDIVEYYAGLVRKDNISCLHLTHASGNGPFLPSKYSDLEEISQKAHCRISCQAALWKKEVLLKYIRRHESAWQFEAFGTKRAHLVKDSFFNVNVSAVRKNRIMPYVLTGVIQGQWKPEVVDLFASNNINVDFSRRGFRVSKAPSLKERIRGKIKRLPRELPSKIDLWKLRIKKLTGIIK